MNPLMPQETKLFKVDSNGAFLNPKLSTEALSITGLNGSSFDLDSPLRLEIFNQNPDYIQLHFNDKDVSINTNGMYYNLNGFDYGVKCYMINLTSPSVCFLPEISATDCDTENNGVNVALVNTTPNTYTVNSYAQFFSNTLSVDNLVLLRNQTITSENKVYRVVSINAGTATLYDDSNDTYESTGKPSINAILNQNQDYIFTRAKVVDKFGTSFYGLYNTVNYQWVKQSEGIKLSTADYGFTINFEISNGYLDWTLFNSKGIAPKQNDIVAINVESDGSGSTGGKTSGLYLVTKIAGGNVYIQPSYEPYIFIHQFFNVKYDYDLESSNIIWFVNPETTTNSSYIYGSQFFNFTKLNLSNVVLGNISLWAQQTGGSNDTVLGFSIFAEPTPNNRIEFSDVFKIGIYAPTWAEGYMNGISINIDYQTNIDVSNGGIIL